MTRNELKDYLKDVYYLLSPDEKKVLCQKYQDKYASLELPYLLAFQLQNGKAPLENLRDFLVQRRADDLKKMGVNVTIQPTPEVPEVPEVHVEEQNQKINDFVSKL